MFRLSRPTLLLFAAATCVGACLHFLFSFFPCIPTALLAPVSESLWEHVKLLYWPGLLFSLPLLRRDPDSMGARAASLLLAVLLMLGVGYLYHVTFHGDCLVFDILLYVLSMAVLFLLPAFLTKPIWRRWQSLFLLLVLGLGVAILLFTFLPPSGLLFTDLSGAPSWATLPC